MHIIYRPFSSLKILPCQISKAYIKITIMLSLLLYNILCNFPTSPAFCTSPFLHVKRIYRNLHLQKKGTEKPVKLKLECVTHWNIYVPTELFRGCIRQHKSNKHGNVEFEVLTAVTVKSNIYCKLTPCNVREVHFTFHTHFLHLWG